MRFAVAAALALGAWSAAFAASLLLSGSAGMVPYLLGVAVFVVSAWSMPSTMDHTSRSPFQLVNVCPSQIFVKPV